MLVLDCNRYNWVGVFFFLSFFLFISFLFSHTVGYQKFAGFQEFVDFVSFNVCAFGCAMVSFFFWPVHSQSASCSPMVKLSLSSIYRFLCLLFSLYTTHSLSLPRQRFFLEQQFSFVLLCYLFCFLFWNSHPDTTSQLLLNVTHSLCFL